MVSKKALHALNATVYIARNAHQRCVPTQEISSALGVSVSYLEGMLKTLKDHGVLHSFRGPGGGYQIGAALADMSVWDVARIFDPQAQAPRTTPGPMPARAVAFETQLAELSQALLHANPSLGRVARVPGAVSLAPKQAGGFKFKPLAPPLVPMCANSVFQLSAFVQGASRAPTAA